MAKTLKTAEPETKHQEIRLTSVCSHIRKKKNFCSKPYKKERKNYYKKWDMKNIKISNIDNKGNK